LGWRGGINPFGYAEHNPLKYVDPDGLAGVLPGPIPLPMPGQVIPGFPSGGSTGDDFGGLFPGQGSNDSGSLFRVPRLPPRPPRDIPRDDPWPSDWKNQCVRLYERCVEQGWRGSCGACLNKCTAQQEWLFEGPGACRPKKDTCK